MLNVRKITDIALKMFNFPFCLCGAHFCSVRWLFKTRFLIFFCQKDFIIHLIHFYTNVGRFMLKRRFIFTQEIRRNVCFRFASTSQSEPGEKEEGNDYKIHFLLSLKCCLSYGEQTSLSA